MTSNKRFNFEILLYLIAFALALGIRMYHLGTAPLSDQEAKWAIQALRLGEKEISQNQQILGPNPAYLVFTWLMFTTFNSTNFLARFLSAFSGSILVFIPYLFSRSFSSLNLNEQNLIRWAGIIMAYSLALSPGMATLSRLAGSSVASLSFMLLAAGFWTNRRHILAGISIGLALISGPGIIIGAIVLLITWFFFNSYSKTNSGKATDDHKKNKQHATEDQFEQFASGSVTSPQNDWLAFLYAGGATILIAGSFFFVFPSLLGAWFGSIPTYLNSWVSPLGIPASRLIAALVIYEPFAVIFTIIMILLLIFKRNHFGEKLQKALLFLILWILIGSVLILVNPGRQIQDLIWIMIPVYALASFALSDLLLRETLNIISLVEAAFIFILFGLSWHMLASMTQIIPNVTESYGSYIVILGIFFLGILTVVLVALGWSWKIGRTGLILGMCVAFLIFTISTLWGSTQVRQNQAVELWNSIPTPGQSDLMLKTISEVSSWNAGTPIDIDIASTIDTPTLRWTLRGFPNVRFISQPKKDEMPSIVITKENNSEPVLMAAYRGEDFVWWISPGWTGALPTDFVRWFTFRDAPLITENLIIWTRSDLFPNGSINSNTPPTNNDDLLLTP
jgi:uncharacterized membrane protein